MLAGQQLNLNLNLMYIQSWVYYIQNQTVTNAISIAMRKANNSNIQQRVVEMKSALEKIKEQLLNVL